MITFVVLIIFHTLFLIFFPVYHKTVWTDLAGMTSLLNVFNFILYLTWFDKSVFANEKHFFIFKISPNHLTFLEFKAFFSRADSILIIIISIAESFLKLDNHYSPFLRIVQLAFSVAGGLCFMILLFKISLRLFGEMNIFSVYLKLFIIILIFSAMSISNYYLPFAGIFFIFFLYLGDTYWSVLANLILIMICVILSARSISLIDYFKKDVTAFPIYK